jgi:RecB family exonuclease
VTELPRRFETHIIGQYLLHPLTVALFYKQNSGLGLDERRLQESLKDFPEPQLSGVPPLAQIREFLNARFDAADAVYMTKAINYCLEPPENSPAETTADFMPRFLADLATLRETFSRSGPREESAWTHAETAARLAQALAPLSHKKGPAGWREFLSQCRRCAAGESVRETGEPMDGIQIIGLTEARYVPFAAVRIVGCVEGSFPHALPRDSLIDNSMRQAMGLSGWNELEALEDTTFHLLTSRLPYVELSYARASEDKPLIRSRWIERLAVSITVEEFIDPYQQTLEAPSADALACDSLEGQTDGVLDITAKASASRLRDLIWCPYRYLMQARKINPVELPQDRSQLKTGNLLHKVLERFFTTEVDDRLEAHLRFDLCPADVSSFITWAHQRLDGIALVTVPKNLARLPQFQHMAGRGWQQVAEQWGVMYATGFSPKQVETEVKIGRAVPLTIAINGRSITIDGSIDAVFKRGGDSILVDYKTGVVPTIKDVEDGVAPQLLIYSWAMAQKEPLTASAVSYLNLSEGRQLFVAVTQDIKPSLTTHGLLSPSAKPADLNNAFTAVKNRWSERLREIEASSRFMADPSDCKYCPYDNICRKNDPRQRDRIKAQAKVRPV